MNKRTGAPRNPAATLAWRYLKQHHKKISAMHLREMFATDPGRPDRFALNSAGLYIDFSKHRVTDETLSLLLAFAEEMNIHQVIQRLFAGSPVNTTEKRPALHTALRSPPDQMVMLEGVNIATQIQNELARMDEFIAQLHDGAVAGSTGRTIDTLVNIGIGGSDLGPRLVTDALKPYSKGTLRVRFVANADPVDINNVLAECDPATTMFNISSKSFTTQETMVNTRLAQQWLRNNNCRDSAGHFVAVTANSDAARKLGILPQHIFQIWNWVGGRYSVWSAIGLPVAACIGMENFRAFLAGAHAMDMHFRNTPLPRNIPAMLALLDIWYINFFNCETLAVIPYSHSLKVLPQYLGQLMMESNGKTMRRDNRVARYHTSAIIWGDTGTNAQHAFMQLLHQGTHLVPVDFLAGLKCDGVSQEQHNILLANCIAQSEALMQGNIADPGREKRGYRTIPGNNPSTTILYERLTPATLGALLALYEHRTYVQACLWNINAFDQWGVELGKTFASEISAELQGKETNPAHDASTRSLIDRCLNKS